MKFVLRRDRGLSLSVLLLLVASFFVFGIGFSPAHATNPAVANNSADGNASSVTSGSTTLTVAAVGDVINVFIEAVVLNSVTPVGISSMTSASATGGFTSRNSATALCVHASGFCGNPGDAYEAVELTAVATASGAITISFTFSGTASGGWVSQSTDIQNVAQTPETTTFGTCNATKTGSCPNPFGTNSASFTSGTAVEVSGAIGISNALASASPVNAEAGYTAFFGGAPNTEGAGMFSTSATSVTSPTTFSENFNGNSGFQTGDIILGAVFGNPSVTSTTVINTNCLGACSSGANATSTYFSTAIPALFVFYASQNTGSQGQIDNFTMKVKAVHINAQTGTLLIGVYTPTTPTNPANGGNQYSLIKSLTYPISNGTTDFFLHANPQANVCSLCFYAAGIMATTTASRGSGATGSGVSFYETSGATSQQFTFNPGGTSLPTTFFSSTVQRPNFFMFIHETYTVATVTTTSTLTQGGTATTTSTVTSTNVINQLDMSKAGFWFLPLLFFLAPMALLIVVKRVADGR